MHERRCSKLNSFRILIAIVVLTTTATYFYLFTIANNVKHEESTSLTGKREYSDPTLRAGDIITQWSIGPHLTSESSSSTTDHQTTRLKASIEDIHPTTQNNNHLKSKVVKHSSYDIDDTPLPRDGMSNGYVLAESFWEQQTSGCRNLQNLQCWAGKYGMNVVEPFVEHSVLHTPFVSMKPSALKFSDMFDLEFWNTESSKLGSSRLVPWNVFVQQAPRDLIVVHLNYYSAGSSKKNSRYSSKSRYLHECPSMKSWPNEKEAYTLTKLKFNIVRRVCINFEYKDFLSLEEFHNVIFGEYANKSVNVFFWQWRGLGPGRVLVKEGGCSNTGIQENMKVSKQVVRDAELYIRKYLSFSVYDSGQVSNAQMSTRNESGYIAIIARLEKSKKSFSKSEGIIPYCFEQLLSYHRSVSKASSLQRTFLSIDIGKYGSHSFRSTGDSSNLDTEFRKFFKKLYGSKQSISNWERTFEDVSHTTDKGYVALLQKVIATKAECVIFIGGGSFQKHALKLYQQSHKEENWCINIVKECTLDKNLPFS